jgi:hypothetical protein
MTTNAEQSVEWEMAGETELLRENLPLCHFVHHKPHMTWPGSNPGHRGGKPVTNRLSYGTGRTSLDKDPRNMRHCMYSITWEYGRSYIEETGIKVGVRVENKNNVKQNFMEKSKLVQHDYEEGIAYGERKPGPYR